MMAKATCRMVVCGAEGVQKTTPRPRKTALVTGGNSGIGFESVKSLSLQGYNVILGCRDENKGRAAREKLLYVERVC